IRMAVNGSDNVDAVLFVIPSARSCRTCELRGRLALDLRSDRDGPNKQGKVVRSRNLPNCRRNQASGAGARWSEGRSLFPACARNRAHAAGKILAAARGDEPGAAMVRSGESG